MRLSGRRTKHSLNHRQTCNLSNRTTSSFIHRTTLTQDSHELQQSRRKLTPPKLDIKIIKNVRTDISDNEWERKEDITRGASRINSRPCQFQPPQISTTIEAKCEI